MRPIGRLASLIFAAVCIGHAVRLCLRWTVTVNGVGVPLWVSGLGMAVTAALAVLLWRETRRG